MGKNQNIWSDRTIESDKMESVSIGNLHLWILFKDSDLWIGYMHDEIEEGETPDPPEDLDWTRWAMEGKVQNVRLVPVFPDLPLIVKSEYTLKIRSKSKIKVFSRMPIWVRVVIPRSDYQLIEVPIIQLSRTWFGTPTEGELCYHATTKARRDLSKIDPKPYLVNCPILISNKSEEDLVFENFCYRVERLGIYQHKNELWADETQIIFQGESLNSEVIMTGKLPEGIAKKQLLTEPRRKIQKSLATRTFKRLFD